MKRIKIARWLLSKLLGSLFVYAIIFWIFPILGKDPMKVAFLEFYAWMTGALSIASLIAHLLVAAPKEPEEGED
jgi:mannose/fructose/N-acetylgalactosamine-specific phosphotransferase system component IIC